MSARVFEYSVVTLFVAILALFLYGIASAL
jgi:hypothetical protein